MADDRTLDTVEDYQQLLADLESDLENLRELLEGQVQVLKDQIELSLIERALLRRRLVGPAVRSVITNAIAFGLCADEGDEEVTVSTEEALHLNDIGQRVQDHLFEYLFPEGIQ